MKDALEVRFKPPSERVLSIFSSPVLSEDGVHIGRVFTSRDATAERRLEGELLQAQKMETLGTLAGGIAHDFNNQLTAILGNSRFALDALPEGHEAEAALRDLVHAAEHCAELTGSLLAFARRAPSEPRASDVAEVVGEVERVLRASLPSAVRFEPVLARDLLAAHVDPTRLQQILLNLCLNARDALPRQGSIHLAARNRTLAEPEARELGMAAGACVELEVRDDGVGMDEWTRARAFDPFFTTKPPGAGTGLGLAVVYGLVRGQGGWVGVESEPGRGATFRVLLPVAPQAPLPAAPADDTPTPRTASSCCWRRTSPPCAASPPPRSVARATACSRRATAPRPSTSCAPTAPRSPSPCSTSRCLAWTASPPSARCASCTPSCAPSS